MAIKKSELGGRITQKKAEIDALESMIDGELQAEYVGGRVIVQITEFPHTRVQQEIERRYREAGWKIKFNSDQCEGVWVELS